MTAFVVEQLGTTALSLHPDPSTSRSNMTCSAITRYRTQNLWSRDSTAPAFRAPLATFWSLETLSTRTPTKAQGRRALDDKRHLLLAVVAVVGNLVGTAVEGIEVVVVVVLRNSNPIGTTNGQDLFEAATRS